MGFKPIKHHDIPQQVNPGNDYEREIWMTAYCTALKSPYIKDVSDPDIARGFAQKCADVALYRMRPLV